MGLAWTVPAVIVAAAAPPLAASPCATLYSFTAVRTFPSDERMTITNTGSTTIPAGTTVTWTVYNNETVARGITWYAPRTNISGPTTGSTTVPSRTRTTFTWTLTSALAPNATAYWSYFFGSSDYRTRITIGNAACTTNSRCVSVINTTVGTTCPP